MEGNAAYILLSTQVALATHVSPFLRAVTVDFIQKQSLLILRFFYDCEVTDELYDLASCACAEIDPEVFPYTIEDDIEPLSKLGSVDFWVLLNRLSI